MLRQLVALLLSGSALAAQHVLMPKDDLLKE